VSKEEYRFMMQDVCNFLGVEFERAARIRDKINSLEKRVKPTHAYRCFSSGEAS